MNDKVNGTLLPPEAKADEASGQRYTPKPCGSWRKLIGRTQADDLSPEAFRSGAEWRERMNAEGK